MYAFGHAAFDAKILNAKTPASSEEPVEKVVKGGEGFVFT
jgi:hypothetical protein